MKKEVTAKEPSSRKLAQRETALAKTLESLASVLLRLGINAPRAEDLLRASFVHAAEALARTQGSRATQSQIATLAGVNRLDVRKLLGARIQQDSQVLARDRMELVLEGWRRDSDFRDSRGRSRPLSFGGSKSEFARLVRKYGRDVSEKSVRLQLVRMGVAQERLGKLVMTHQGTKQTRELIAARADLHFLRAQLRSIQLQAGRRVYTVRSAAVYVSNQKTAKRLQKATLEKIRLMLAGLDSMAQVTHTRSQPRAPNLHRVIVTATVATESGAERE